MNGEVVSSCFDKTVQIMIRPLDHQMHVIKKVISTRQRLHKLRAKRNIIHEMAVHDVEVQPVSSAANGPRHFFREAAPVGSKDTRGNDDFLRVVKLSHGSAPCGNPRRGQCAGGTAHAK